MVGCIPSTCSSDTRTTAVATQTRSTCLIARHTATVHATHHSTQLHLIGLTFCLRISSLSSCILSHPHPPSAHRPMPKSQVTLNSAVLPLLVPRLPHRSLFQVCSHRISSHRITTMLMLYCFQGVGPQITHSQATCPRASSPLSSTSFSSPLTPIVGAACPPRLLPLSSASSCDDLGRGTPLIVPSCDAGHVCALVSTSLGSSYSSTVLLTHRIPYSILVTSSHVAVT